MPDQASLEADLGDRYTKHVVSRFRRFCYAPQSVIESLAGEALAENWGSELFVMEKYLAVHVAWSVEQGRYTEGDGQFYTTAGHLQTRYGTPLYLVFEPNRNPGRQPWCLVHAGSFISAPTLPVPPDIPSPPPIPADAEVVLMHDHILGGRGERVPFLAETPPVAQMCAVSGAIQWSLNRGLELRYWYFGRMNYLVPMYLQSRENITRAPDLIAPVQVNPDSLLVRTVLEPHMPYANARVAVQRHDQLPPWLLDAWNESADQMSSEEIEDPEAEPSEPPNVAGTPNVSNAAG